MQTAPDQDAFYQVPADVSSHPNGAILRARPVTTLLVAVPMATPAWQLLYKTTDPHGIATATVATVMVPSTPWTGLGPRPLLSYQVAEDGNGTRCAPSYVLRAGFNAGLGAGQGDAMSMAGALARGWAVVSPDYEGPQSLMASGPMSAHGILD